MSTFTLNNAKISVAVIIVLRCVQLVEPFQTDRISEFELEIRKRVFS